MPEMPEITENPKVLMAWPVSCMLYYSLFLYCFPISIVSLSIASSSIVPAHTIGSTGLLVLLFYPLLFHLLIVFTYYTAPDRHSISSSTSCIGLSK